MSAQIPYHLRTNKTVERTLFVELLRRIESHLPRSGSKYHYVSMGGPLLEDFSAVQTALGCHRMTCLEIDAFVRSRQRFNRPNCRVVVAGASAGQFAEAYEAGGDPLIVWFDYTNADWREQISDATVMLRKLPDMSIFKITFAAMPRSLNPNEKGKDVMDGRVENLAKMFESYGPFSRADVEEAGFVKTLHRIFRRRVAEIIPDSSERVCRPLASYYYSDSSRMLTITVIVGPAARISDLKRNARLHEWPYATNNWELPLNINIPELSIRERLAIDQLMPDTALVKLHSTLGVRFSDELTEFREHLRRYVRFAKHVPYFAKVNP